MLSDRYFYKTVAHFAREQGFTLLYLSEACGIKAETLSKQLRRVGGSDLTILNCLILRQIVAPNLTLDELYPEAFANFPKNIPAKAD